MAFGACVFSSLYVFIGLSPTSWPSCSRQPFVSPHPACFSAWVGLIFPASQGGPPKRKTKKRREKRVCRRRWEMRWGRRERMTRWRAQRTLASATEANRWQRQAVNSFRFRQRVKRAKGELYGEGKWSGSPRPRKLRPRGGRWQAKRHGWCIAPVGSPLDAWLGSGTGSGLGVDR